jgi:hypothetical protein
MKTFFALLYCLGVFFTLITLAKLSHQEKQPVTIQLNSGENVCRPE